MIIISFQKRKNRITIMQAIINKSKQSNKINKYKSSTFNFIFFYFSFFFCLSKLIKGNLINLLRFLVVELPF